MILTSFTYKEPGWSLQDLSPLQQSNLLVGRNATGKTRTIRALQNASAFVQMKRAPFSSDTFSTAFVLEGENSTMEYSFSVAEGKITSEKLVVDGKRLISRTDRSARYDGHTINPPVDRLVVQTRRDLEDYPEIERLMLWFEGVVCLSCSDITPFTSMIPDNFFNPIPFSDMVSALSKTEKEEVRRDSRDMGYDIVDFNPVVTGGDIKLVAIKERYLQKNILDISLSSGMLRVLYVLCFLRYIKHSASLSLLIIDDLGEGLDYARSTKLGKMVFGGCESDGLQLVASSNDAFLMDVVDIEQWQVLRRKNSMVSSLNANTYPDLFRSFRQTGLSNFDFFSSDYIDTYLHTIDKK